MNESLAAKRSERRAIETKEQAIAEIDILATELEELLNAAKDIKVGLEKDARATIKQGLRTFDYYTDGYWGALVVHRKLGALYEYLEPEEEENAASNR